MILTQDKEELTEAKHLLQNEMINYKLKTYRKWVYMVFGIFIGLLFSIPTEFFFQYANYSLYKREGLEQAVEKYFGDVQFKDIIMDELLINVYDYNSQTPRFYSNYFQKYDGGYYNVPIRVAAAASSSAPIYFDPTTRENTYGFSESLVDGGVICNNPSFYAYQHAKYLQHAGNPNGYIYNLVSLGTGESAGASDVKKESEFTKFDSLSLVGDFMITFEMIAADFV